MSKKRKLTIEIDQELYELAKVKANKELCMPLATLVRVFLKSFTSQKGVGFFVGNQDLASLITKWISHRKFEKFRGSRLAVGRPKLRDIFELKD